MIKANKPSKKQYGILVDLDYCLGCGVCVIACKQENDLPPFTDDKPYQEGTAWNQVLCTTEGTYPDLTQYYLPVHCMHCQSPPCIASCPKNAIYKQQDGILLIDGSKCNGCEDQQGSIKRCIPACPYGAIQFNERKGVAEACTLCMHRIDDGSEPACVRACIGRCLYFGNLYDPESSIARKITEIGKDNIFTLNPEKGTQPSVQYIKPKNIDIKKVNQISAGMRIYGFRKALHIG